MFGRRRKRRGETYNHAVQLPLFGMIAGLLKVFNWRGSDVVIHEVGDPVSQMQADAEIIRLKQQQTGGGKGPERIH